jgi:hypothetical protein
VLVRRALTRLLIAGGEAVVVCAWAQAWEIRFRAEAPSRAAAAEGIERMRFALGVDNDLTGFHARFRTRCASSSPRTRSTPAWPASTRCSDASL